MPSRKRNKPLPRFNQWSVGRAAVLLRRDKTPQAVAEYYFKRYGRKWNIPSASAMQSFLFTPRPGRRPNFSGMFEGKTPNESKAAFHDWLAKSTRHRQQARERTSTPTARVQARLKMERLNADPHISKRRRTASDASSKRLWADPAHRAHISRKTAQQNRKFWSNPSWKGRQRALQSVGQKKRWQRARALLVDAFKSRGLVGVFENERSTGKIHTPTVVHTRTPSRAVLELETRAKIQEAISSLTRIQREAIELSFFQGKPLKEVAAAMHMSEEKLESTLKQAFAHLAPRLAEWSAD